MLVVEVVEDQDDLGGVEPRLGRLELPQLLQVLEQLSTLNELQHDVDGPGVLLDAKGVHLEWIYFLN